MLCYDGENQTGPRVLLHRVQERGRVAVPGAQPRRRLGLCLSLSHLQQLVAAAARERGRIAGSRGRRTRTEARGRPRASQAQARTRGLDSRGMHGPEERLATAARPAERKLWLWPSGVFIQFPAASAKCLLLPRPEQKPFLRWPFAPAHGLLLLSAGDSRRWVNRTARRHLQRRRFGASAACERWCQCHGHGVGTSPVSGRLRWAGAVPGAGVAQREGCVVRARAWRGGARWPAFGAAR